MGKIFQCLRCPEKRNSRKLIFQHIYQDCWKNLSITPQINRKFPEETDQSSEENHNVQAKKIKVEYSKKELLKNGQNGQKIKCESCEQLIPRTGKGYHAHISACKQYFKKFEKSNKGSFKCKICPFQSKGSSKGPIYKHMRENHRDLLNSEENLMTRQSQLDSNLEITQDGSKEFVKPTGKSFNIRCNKNRTKHGSVYYCLWFDFYCIRRYMYLSKVLLSKAY